MPLDDFLSGLLFLAATAGACLAIALLVQRRRLAHLSGTPRVSAVATLGLATVVVSHLLPGLAGLLSRWSVLAMALLVLAAVGLGVRQRPAARVPRVARETEAEGTLSWVVAGSSLGAVALWLLASAWNRTALPPEDVDTLTFHFPIIAEWIQGGSIWPVQQFTPLLAHGNYPATGDVAFLALILPWSNEWLAGALNPALIALTGLTVHAIARELGAARPQAILAAALLTSMPAVAGPANGAALTDSFMFATFSAGVLFLLRHERGAPRAELWLAAVALGLAFGSKWYGVPAVGAVAAVAVGARLVRRRGLGATVRDGAVAGAVVALFGGVWMLRNAIESGSPIFPAEMAIFGITLFDTPYNPIFACADFTIADYLGDWDVWSAHITPPLRQAFTWPGAAIGAGLVAAGLLSSRPRLGPSGAARGSVVAGVILAVLLVVAYALTPTGAAGPEGRPTLVGANARYGVPAFVVAAPLVAWALANAGRLRIALELACAAAVAYGIHESFEVPLRVVAAALGALVVAALAVWALLALTGRLRTRARDRVRLAALAACVPILVAAGHDRQRAFNTDRYATGGAETWIIRNAPTGHRIALAGAWSNSIRSPVWPAFGSRLGNEVDYLGETVDGQLREHGRRDEWERAIRRGGYDLLLVGRGGYNEFCPVPGSESDDDRWAREAGFEQVARDASLTLYRVPAAG